MQGSVLADWQKDKSNQPAFVGAIQQSQQPQGQPAFVDATAGQTLGLNVRPPEPEPAAPAAPADPAVDPNAPAQGAPPAYPAPPATPQQPQGNPYGLTNQQENMRQNNISATKSQIYNAQQTLIAITAQGQSAGNIANVQARIDSLNLKLQRLESGEAYF